MLINEVIKITKHRDKFCSVLNSLNRNVQLIKLREYDSYAYGYIDNHNWIRGRIGNREIVGHGVSGQPEYADRPDFPFPSIRFMPRTAQIQAVREKEKGKWHELTIDEKKLLYRSQFRLTFVEFQHPRGEWKFVLGLGFVLLSAGLWLSILMKLFVYDKMKKLKSFTKKSKREQLKRMINLRTNPIHGLASQWDYENKKWKTTKPLGAEFDDPFDLDYDEDCE